MFANILSVLEDFTVPFIFPGLFCYFWDFSINFANTCWYLKLWIILLSFRCCFGNFLAVETSLQIFCSFCYYFANFLSVKYIVWICLILNIGKIYWNNIEYSTKLKSKLDNYWLNIKSITIHKFMWIWENIQREWHTSFIILSAENLPKQKIQDWIAFSELYGRRWTTHI